MISKLSLSILLVSVLSFMALAQAVPPRWLVNPDVDGQKIAADLFAYRRDSIDRQEASSLDFQRPNFAQTWEQRARQFARSAHATLEGVDLKDRQAVYDRIVETSDTQDALVCTNATGRSASSLTAADCSFTGTVNSGSGIGVAVGLTFANRPVRSILVCRAGICFPYDHVVTTHSEISGACFSAQFTVTVTWADGTSCTAATMGSPPHSACTDTAIANSAAFVSAASFSEQMAPETIGTGFNVRFTDQTAFAPSVPLPLELAGVKAYVFLNTPLQQQVPLFFASPGQATVLLSKNLAYGGLATVQFVNVASDTLRPGFFSSNQYEPGIFTLAQNGHGAAAGYVDRGYTVLFGTGFNAAATGFGIIGNQRYPASYVGPQGQFVGLYQVNIPPGLPRGSSGQVCAGPNDRCSQFFQFP